MFRRGIRGFLFVAVLGSLLLVGVALRLGSARKPAGESLVLALPDLTAFALVHIAEGQGFFEEEGIRVEVRETQSGKEAIESVTTGEADLGAAFDTPVVLQSFESHDLAILTTLHRGQRNSGIVARRDRGIRRPRDLVGKRVGIVEGTASEYFLSVFLAYEGIPDSEVRRVPIRTSDLIPALREGRVDAIAAWNPFLLEARNEVSGNVFYSDVFIEISMLVGLRANIVNKKDAIQRFIRALVRAETLYLDAPDQAFALFSARHGGYSLATQRELWESFIPVAELSNVLLLVLQQEAEWFRERRRVHEAVPEYERLLFPEFLEEANPDEVTLIRGVGR